MFYHIHIVGILVAAIAATTVGMLWYSPYLFGKKWMALVGFPNTADLSPERKVEMKKKANQAMSARFGLALLTAFVLERVIYNTPMVTFQLTMTLSIFLWLGLVAATNISDYVYDPAPKPWMLYIINQGGHLAMILVMTIVLYFLT